jgi:hypothetical protein
MAVQVVAVHLTLQVALAEQPVHLDKATAVDLVLLVRQIMPVVVVVVQARQVAMGLVPQVAQVVQVQARIA